MHCVRTGEFVGFVERDIEIPNKLPESLETDMPSEVYFDDYPPLFAQTKVTFEQMSPVMKEYIIKQGLSTGPRKALLSGLRAKRVLSCSSLLKWYLDHFMQVTKIYQEMETCQNKCFRNFINEMVQGRREADVDPNKKAMRLVYKLLMNSAYGSLLQNPSRYKNVKYVKSEYDALKFANEPLFSHLSELDSVNEFYKVQMFKKKHNDTIPIYLGMLCLQLAKQQVLDLYYNFLLKYISWNDWHPVCSDSNSAYIALNTPSIQKAIKPSMMQAFLYGIKGQCTNGQVMEIDNKYRWFVEHAEKNVILQTQDNQLFSILNRVVQGLEMNMLVWHPNYIFFKKQVWKKN